MFSRAAVFALFYLSGIAGLIYQVLWLRRLSVVFGVTIYAASTVLAAFGAAEFLIGFTGLLSPLLLDAAWTVYDVLHTLVPESLTVLTVARLLCSFAILAIPATMMGITLPLLTAALSNRDRWSGTHVSLLYSLNTLAAMTGSLLAGYILIPAIGIRSAFMLAAGPDEMRRFVGDGPILTDDRPLVEYHHWLPRPDDQPPLNVSSLKGDVSRFIARASTNNR